jgi:hypothetical protein
MYQLNRRIIDAAIRNGELTAYCFIGKKKMIKQSDVEKWFEKKRVEMNVPLIRGNQFYRVK